MIDMFLKGASNKNETGYETYNYVVPGQQTISLILLIVALLAAPIMLYVKPMILKKQLKHHNQHDTEEEHHKIEYSKAGDNVGSADHYDVIRDILRRENQPEGHHSFGDIFIH